jgi:hypothetical protein
LLLPAPCCYFSAFDIRERGARRCCAEQRLLLLLPPARGDDTRATLRRHIFFFIFTDWPDYFLRFSLSFNIFDLFLSVVTPISQHYYAFITRQAPFSILAFELPASCWLSHAD